MGSGQRSGQLLQPLGSSPIGLGDLPRGLFCRNLACRSQSALLGVAPLRQIARDLREAGQRPVLATDCGNDDVRPEPRSILPQAPAFFLIDAFLLGDLELVLRVPDCIGFWRIEDRKVFPDYFIRGIPFDSLSAFVPRRDVTGRIEHEDRVILYAVDEKTKTFFAFPQLLFRHPPLGELARDLGVADQMTRCIAQGGDDDVGPESRTVFSYAPALVLKAADTRGFAQLVFRKPFLNFFARIKNREMFADDLLGGVALEPLRARVPAQDVAVRIEGKNRIVIDVLDEESV